MNTRGMQRVGQGAFSIVYRKSVRKVLIKSRDTVKECMADGCFPNTKLFPQLRRVGTSSCGGWCFYEERYYKKVTSLRKTLSSFDWEFYKWLKDGHHGDGYQNVRSFFNKIPSKFHHKRKMLLESLDALANYGFDVCFEISPRNVATSGNKLVLLDCFFFSHNLTKIGYHTP